MGGGGGGGGGGGVGEQGGGRGVGGDVEELSAKLYTYRSRVFVNSLRVVQ